MRKGSIRKLCNGKGVVGEVRRQQWVPALQAPGSMRGRRALWVWNTLRGRSVLSTAGAQGQCCWSTGGPQHRPLRVRGDVGSGRREGAHVCRAPQHCTWDMDLAPGVTGFLGGKGPR